MNDHFPAMQNSNSVAPNRKTRSGVTIIELVVGVTTAVMLLGLVGAFLLPATRSAREPARRSTCKNNLKQIGLALHNYADTYGAFPPAYTVDADGKRLHSWRTLILPYMDHHTLYEKIDLSKAWDDPANAEVFQKEIHTYRCPSADSPNNHTTYLAVVTSNSCIQASRSKQFSEITDGLSNTVIVIEVEAEHAVHWMSPIDADENLVSGAVPESALPHQGGMHALFADGSVQFLSAEMPAAKRRALISVDGGEQIEID